MEDYKQYQQETSNKVIELQREVIYNQKELLELQRNKLEETKPRIFTIQNFIIATLTTYIMIRRPRYARRLFGVQRI